MKLLLRMQHVKRFDAPHPTHHEQVLCDAAARSDAPLLQCPIRTLQIRTTIGDTPDFDSNSGKVCNVRCSRTFGNVTNIKKVRLDLVPRSSGNSAIPCDLSPYSTMPLTKDNLCQIATLFLDAFDKLSAEAHLALRADTCIHIFAPSSLGVPTKNNEQFASHLTNNIKPVLAAFPVTAKETHIHLIPTGGQITIWATGIPHFKEEAKGGEEDEVWRYMGEYIFMLDINDQQTCQQSSQSI
jgi:hypothetical protein